MPRELEENTDKTIVLLTESNPSIDLSGNNTFFGKTERVEIQIFYKADIDFDIEAFEKELLSHMRENEEVILDIKDKFPFKISNLLIFTISTNFS